MLKIIQGDFLKVLPKLPKARMIFADPPDNLGVKYDGFEDKWENDSEYLDWLMYVAIEAVKAGPESFWMSYYWKWDVELKGRLWPWGTGYDIKPYVWWYTFGQHQQKDNASCFRPMLRFSKPGIKWNTDAIREPSARLREYGDSRADPRGRVPGDVWVPDGTPYSNAPYVSIPLHGKRSGKVIVSPQDADLIDLCSWSADTDGYAIGKHAYKKLRMHRVVAERMGLDMGMQIDHADRNKLNNCRHNLRTATSSEQAINIDVRSNNTSGTTGVYFQQNKWVAKLQGKYLGQFDTKEEAVAVRVAATNKAFPEFVPERIGLDDSQVWQESRVCGTFKEKRKWNKNQHPEALMERMILMSTNPGDLVIDLFGGTFTTARVCDRLGRDCISIEISPFYCEKGAEELGCKVERGGQ